MVGLLVWAVLASCAALYCRNEWVASTHERNKQRDLAYAATISADFWFTKYQLRERSRPGSSERNVTKELLTRHRELNRKFEKMQLAQ